MTILKPFIAFLSGSGLRKTVVLPWILVLLVATEFYAAPGAWADGMLPGDEQLTWDEELNLDDMDDIFFGLPDRSSDTSTMTAAEPLEAASLSLNSIVMFALDNNPDVGMALAREDQATHNIGRAKAALYPRVDLTAGQAMEYNNPAAGKNPPGPAFSPSDRVAIALDQLLYDGGITTNTIKQREQVAHTAGLDTQKNTQDVLTETVKQYLAIYRYQQTLADTQRFNTRMKSIVDVINTTYEMGGSAKSNVEYAQSRMAAAESNMESVRSSLNDALSNLEYLTGPLPPFVPLSPDELDPERLPIDQYVKLAEDNNVDVQMNLSDLEAMKYKLKSDKGTYMPRVNVTVTGEKTYDDGGYSGRDLNGKALLQVSYNLFNGFETKETVKRTEAMITELELKQQKVIKDLRKRIKLSYNQLTSLQTSLSKTQAEIRSSEALQALNRQNFEQGNINLIELIEGEERLNTAYGKLHQQRSDLYMAAYKLLLDVGILRKNFFCSEC